jgi:hypothetical protein
MNLTDATIWDSMDELKRRGVTGARYTAYVSPPPPAKCQFCKREAADLHDMGIRGHRCRNGTGCFS